MSESVRLCLKVCSMLALSFVLFSGELAFAETPTQMKLMPPQKDVGKTVMEALSLRQSNRQFSEQGFSVQNLSNLLWAAFGANRENGRRTIPTARNEQNILVYVILKTGVWTYDGLNHTLNLVKNVDLTSKFKAPVTLVYVAPKEPADVSGMHIGSIYQNVGLYCASANLSNVVKTNPRDVLAENIELPDGHRAFVVQLVGNPG